MSSRVVETRTEMKTKIPMEKSGIKDAGKHSYLNKIHISKIDQLRAYLAECYAS